MSTYACHSCGSAFKSSTTLPKWDRYCFACRYPWVIVETRGPNEGGVVGRYATLASAEDGLREYEDDEISRCGPGVMFLDGDKLKVKPIKNQ